MHSLWDSPLDAVRFSTRRNSAETRLGHSRYLEPIALGVHLFFIAIRKTKLTVGISKTKIIQQHLLPFKHLKCKEIKTECVYLANHRRYGRRRVDEQLAVFARDSSRKRLLANEHTCSEILELFAWLESAMAIRCIDLKKRKPVGDL